jgi:hypothetical protein
MAESELENSDSAKNGTKTGIPSAILSFVAAVRKKVYDNLVSSVAAAAVAIIMATALFVWKPLKFFINEKLSESKNISNAEALRIARNTPGGKNTIWAIPFRNHSDDNQYIAVWYETDYKNDPCEGDANGAAAAPIVPKWCDFVLGPIELDILVGGDGIYERRETHVTSGTRAGIMDKEYLDTITKSSGASLQHHWGIVDHDGDGKKEVLSIADSRGTSATLPVYVSLYETATGKVRQLRSLSSRFSQNSDNVFVNVDSNGMHEWLIARFNEFREVKADQFHEVKGDLCQRSLTGKLSCTKSALAPPPSTDDKWLANNWQDWIDNNGVDFTTGKIKLTWTKGRFDSGQEDCVARMGNLEWRNVFKGPLVVNDLAGGRKAVAYLQDGDHHREIPTIIVGKHYVWLALVVDKEILAIDPKTFEVKQFVVPEFAKGIPVSWSVPGEAPEYYSDEQIKATKDFRLEGLGLKGNSLAYDETELTLDVPPGEFVGAMPCQAQDSQ